MRCAFECCIPKLWLFTAGINRSTKINCYGQNTKVSYMLQYKSKMTLSYHHLPYYLHKVAGSIPGGVMGIFLLI